MATKNRIFQNATSINDIDTNAKKTYYENLLEISKDELFDGLLGYGLFAEKIPPFLSSEEFLNFCKNPPQRFNFNNKPKRYINYESIRNINVPRLLSIPNPFAYRNQCKILEENWDKLLEYFKEKTKDDQHKISRIHIRKIDNRFKILHTCYEDEEDMDFGEYSALEAKHLFEMNHTNFCKDDFPEQKILIGKNYIVQADISNCFPSIYTHSISWALVGKEESKNNIRNFSKWYNKIDETTRDIKDAETHGILIGQHSSNLISEIILVSIDSKLGKKYKYIRNIDDYKCYVKTYEEAEQFLLDLSVELKKYNLSLNHKKTTIAKLPLASTEHWARKLNIFVFPNDKKIKLRELKVFLDVALELMKHNKNNSAILNYAIKILSSKNMTNNAKEYFVDTIHHLVLIYPYLVTLLDDNLFFTFSLSVAEIKKISKNIFEVAYEKKLYEPMSYALFFGIKYNFKISDNLFGVIDNNRDAILMLLAYLHDKKFLNNSKNFNRSSIGKKYKELAQTLLNDIDEYWVYIYEVLTAGLLKNEWKQIKKNNVSFVKKEFGV